MKPHFLSSITRTLGLLVLLFLSIGGIAWAMFRANSSTKLSGQVDSEHPLPWNEKSALAPLAHADDMWTAPDWTTVEEEENADEIRYGKELIANTSEFLGPNGSVRTMSNGMNCQNCHLKAGRLPLGNNYGGVFSTYPRVRARSGTSEDIFKRINDCFERSLNGEPLELESPELKAMAAYINWVGKGVPKGEKPAGAGIYELPLLDRAANPARGKVVYEDFCQRCHGANGEGLARDDGVSGNYPPLWGPGSYTTAAGLYRLSRFAGFVKVNMPFGATFESPILTDEESWDVAAYVNSLERPEKFFAQDWPDISTKPMDHPFGPYDDGFEETQHKYGPFRPIQEARLSRKP
jgi:thiosulfate dehydrogenase